MARVSTTFWWIVPPGKELEFIEINVRAKKIHMRLGADNAVLGRVQIGEKVGQFIYQTSFSSGEAYGKFIEASANDSEWMALWAEGIKKQVATLSNSAMGIGIDI